MTYNYSEELKKIGAGETGQLSLDYLCASFINLSDAGHNLSESEYQKVKELYMQYQQRNEKESYNKAKYAYAVADIILSFNAIAPFEKYGMNSKAQNKEDLANAYRLDAHRAAQAENSDTAKKSSTIIHQISTLGEPRPEWYDNSKKKHLGVIHILFSCIHLPLSILYSLYTIINAVVWFIDTLNFVWIPVLISAVLTVFYSFFTFMAIRKKLNTAFPFIIAHFSNLCLTYITADSFRLGLGESYEYYIPIGSITSIVIIILMSKYYKNRMSYFNNTNYEGSYIYKNIEKIVPKIYAAVLLLTIILIVGFIAFTDIVPLTVYILPICISAVLFRIFSNTEKKKKDNTGATP